MKRFRVQYYTVENGKTPKREEEVEAENMREEVEKVQGAANQRIYVTEITKGD